MTKTNQRELKRHRLQLMDGGHCYLDVWIDQQSRVTISRMPSRLSPSDFVALRKWLSDHAAILAPEAPIKGTQHARRPRT